MSNSNQNSLNNFNLLLSFPMKLRRTASSMIITKRKSNPASLKNSWEMKVRRLNEPLSLYTIIPASYFSRQGQDLTSQDLDNKLFQLFPLKTDLMCWISFSQDMSNEIHCFRSSAYPSPLSMPMFSQWSITRNQLQVVLISPLHCLMFRWDLLLRKHFRPGLNPFV